MRRIEIKHFASFEFEKIDGAERMILLDVARRIINEMTTEELKKVFNVTKFDPRQESIKNAGVIISVHDKKRDQKIIDLLSRGEIEFTSRIEIH